LPVFAISVASWRRVPLIDEDNLHSASRQEPGNVTHIDSLLSLHSGRQERKPHNDLIDLPHAHERDDGINEFSHLPQSKGVEGEGNTGGIIKICDAGPSLADIEGEESHKLK
jgi:hypothetical protein